MPWRGFLKPLRSERLSSFSEPRSGLFYMSRERPRLVGSLCLLIALFVVSSSLLMLSRPQESNSNHPEPRPREDLLREKRRFERENRRLELELKLARDPSLYAVVDLEALKLNLKMRGVLLREFDIQSAELSSTAFEGSAIWVLEAKKASSNPSRARTQPARAEDRNAANGAGPVVKGGSFEESYFDLEDMPSRFALAFEEGLIIWVNSAAGNRVERIKSLRTSIAYRLEAVAFGLWGRLKGKRAVSVFLTLDEDDAKSLFWSLSERSRVLIVFPARAF